MTKRELALALLANADRILPTIDEWIDSVGDGRGYRVPDKMRAVCAERARLRKAMKDLIATEQTAV